MKSAKSLAAHLCGVAVDEWARSAWEAYAAHHQLARQWLALSAGTGR